MIPTHDLPLPAWSTRLTYGYRPGAGPTILFVHGLAGSGIEEYGPLSSHPKLSHRPLLAPDLIGFGHSEKNRHFDYLLSTQVEILKELMTTLKIPQVFLVGHSLGGTIGVLFAQKYPELLCGLVLAEGGLRSSYLAPARWAARHKKEEAFAKKFQDLLSLSPAEGGLLGDFGKTPTLSMTDARAFYHTSRSLMEETRDDTLSSCFYRLALPREYWIGEKSIERWGGAYIEELTQQGIPYRVIPGAGHQLVLENPSGFGDALADFVQSVEN